MYFQSYSPKDVVIIVNGNVMTGLDPNTFITLERNAPVLTNVIGISGEVAPIKTTDHSGTVTITLMQASPSNNFLQNELGFYESAYSSGPFIALSELVIVDLSGLTVVLGHNGYLVEYPTVALGASQQSRTWKYFCQHLAF